jgi:hypothetical protein
MRHFLTIALFVFGANNQLQAAPHYSGEKTYTTEEHPTITGNTIPVTVTALNNGVLTCSITSIVLYASTTATGVTYHWTSTNGFESDLQNPTVIATGTYTVKVTNSKGSGSASVTVTENFKKPDVSASGSSLTCLPNAALYASSTTPNVIYSWVGPYSFSSTLQRPTNVTNPGTYTVTVTNPVNGCTASKAVTVAAAASTTIWTTGFTVPDGTTHIDTGLYQWTTSYTGTATTKFSPANYEFRASNIGAGKEATWTSQVIDISGKANVGVAVHVRSCVSDSTVVLEADTSANGDYLRLYYKLDDGPEVLFHERSGAINNNYANYTTAAIGSLAGANIQVIIKTRASDASESYFFDNVTITGAKGNGFQTGITGNNAITCINSTATLTGVSPNTGVTYKWFGPGGFTASSQTISVTATGDYTLLAKDSASGCNAVTVIPVTQNITYPLGTASSNNTLSCRRTSTELKGNSTTAGATFKWTGPNNFTDSAANTVVTIPGDYFLRITDPVNGCTGEVSITVAQNITQPEAAATNNGPISCSTPEITLTGSSATAGLTYYWTGPNAFSSSSQITGNITTAGVYHLIVTDNRSEGNGCSSTYTTEVIEDFSDCFTIAALSARGKANNNRLVTVK